MLKRCLAIASLVILAATGTSHAQTSRQGTYIYQDSPRGYSLAPAYYPAANVENSRAFYPNSADPDKVLINVTVPADAKVTFQGTKTAQTGSSRRFVSPSLAAGYRYTYNVQATWMENGQPVNQSRSFAVQPGEVVHITFTRDAVNVRPE